MGGWASNSKYPFLGAIRSAAKMVSYEVSIGVIIINVLLCVGSLNLNDIVEAQQNMWFVIPLFPMFVIFFISAKTCVALNGITAQEINAKVIVTIGSKMKITLFELEGIMISLKIYFNVSASD